ncbi:MAG: AsmA-like C-terminal region-containing protein [Pseudomonadota bacterium]
MAFKKRPAKAPRQGFAGWIGTCCNSTLSLISRVVLSLIFIVVLAAGVLCLRLMQGPIEVTGLGQLIAAKLNEHSQDVRVSTGAMMLTLGDGRVPAGLQFEDVNVESLDGVPLFSAPRLGTSFHLSDLIHGRVQPVRLTLVEADAQFIRSADGRIRFGLGQQAGIDLAVADGGSTTSDGLDAITSLIDNFVGDKDNAPELAELQLIEIIGANLIYDDRLDGGTWSTQDADLRITRNADGATAILQVDDIRSGTPGASLRVVAERRRGTGVTKARASFGRLDTTELANQLPALGWMKAFGATIEGAMQASFDERGGIAALVGELVAEDGVIRGLEPELPFDQILLRFLLDPEGGLIVDHGRFAATGIDAEIDALARLDRSDPDAPPGVSVQIGIKRVALDQPELFEKQIEFDDGQFALRWEPGPARVVLTDSWIGRDGLVAQINGQVRQNDEGAVTDLRVQIPEMSVEELIAHWPLDAAKNARTWVAENITRATIDDLIAQVRLGKGEPVLDIAFGYSALDSTYIEGMSPIQNASGRAFVNLSELHLDMAEGQVTPTKGQSLSLAGSRLVISDFEGFVTPADIEISARGPSQAVAALINQKPLSLLTKLGLKLDTIGGQSTVKADLNFPLISDLRVADVNAKAKAQLLDVKTTFPIGDAEPAEVRAKRLDLSADINRMELKGKASIDGAPVDLAWRENYGDGGVKRSVDLKGQLTPELLSRIGVEDLPFEGSAAFNLSVGQEGSAPATFLLDADLAKARIEITALDWTKKKGQRGQLKISGAMKDGPSIESLSLDTESLKASGSIQMTEDGGIAEARFDQVKMPGQMDVGANIRFGADGVPEIWITGRMLDVTQRLEGAGDRDERSKDPILLNLDVRQLRIGEKLVLTGAKGALVRDNAGALEGEIEGNLAERAPVKIGLDIKADGSGGIVLTSPDAGEALRAADLYRDARGGTLFLRAELGKREEPDLIGQLRIENVRVRSKATFREVLRGGGLEDAEEVVSNEGIGFRKIWVPFSYDGGVVTLTDAIAVSPMLGLKLNGTLDEDSELLDMVGVMSPAYALTGALNDIPLLGDLLGGEGEGLLAMTFTLKGQMRDPNFSINPLSILTPGLLRRVFTGRGDPSGGPEREFDEREDR